MTSLLSTTIQIYDNQHQQWTTAGTLTLLGDQALGYQAATAFEYDFAYLENRQAHIDSKDLHAVSVCLPLDYRRTNHERWPSFCLDLIPSGAARRYFEQLHKLPNSLKSDWEIFLRGGFNPPGNLRVPPPEFFLNEKPHAGFSRADILKRKEDFIEYARQFGAPVSGSTGAGGDAPKFLLREDHKGRFHADGVLPDNKTKQCWIVKFPRGKLASDRTILKVEKHYMDVAKKLGLKVDRTLIYESDCLFIPRFDRVFSQKKLLRLGLESLCSATGVSEFGAPIGMMELCNTIWLHSTKREDDLAEFIKRDILNIALGNTDNHARNTSFLKGTDGNIRLSPLYDFAPMFLDDQGIARTCRWPDAIDRGGNPDWPQAVAVLEKNFSTKLTKLRREVTDFLKGFADIVTVLEDCHVPNPIIKAKKTTIEAIFKTFKKGRSAP